MNKSSKHRTTRETSTRSLRGSEEKIEETYIKIKGFDEDYFMYVEDVDFCKKVANIGLKRVFIPGLSYIHYVGFNKKKNPMLVKGYKIYINKHFKGIPLLLISIALTINSFVKNIKSRF